MASSLLPDKVKSALKLVTQGSDAVWKTTVKNGQTDAPQEASYSNFKVIGNGSFGVVCLAKSLQTSESVAIKIVYQDKRFKNRELQIMKILSHQNIVKLREYFYRTDEHNDNDVYLNLVLEYVPDTVFNVAQSYIRQKQLVPQIHVKLYIYQLLRSLGYLHSLGVCHRDIKPQNLLLDPSTGIVKLCDFGSAKMLVSGESNVSYICSRYYRAPELLMGASDYTTAVDIWSAGCVMAELLLGTPIFPGNNDVDQMVQIIKVLGTPSKDQILSLNPKYSDFKFPAIKQVPWSKVFSAKISEQAGDLLDQLLHYVPLCRIAPLQALCHPYFDELRSLEAVYCDGKPLPDIFNFSPQELNSCPALASFLMPAHAKRQLEHGKQGKFDASSRSPGNMTPLAAPTPTNMNNHNSRSAIS